jgi:hypothetical protein
MKIGIDARWIFPQISGIGTYTLELIRNLAQLDAQNEYVLLFGDEAILQRTLEYAKLSSRANFETQLVPYGIFFARQSALHAATHETTRA